MLGLSLLLPWNALLKSLPYVLTRIPTEWKDSGPLWLTLSFTLSNFLALGMLTVTNLDSKMFRRIGGGGTGDIIGMRLRVGLLGCAGLLGLACVVPLSDLTLKQKMNNVWVSNGSDENNLSVLILFWCIFMCTGWLMCLLQRSVYPLMALLPGKKELMIPAMLTGQAVAGIAAYLGSFMFSQSSASTSGNAGMALFYFGTSILILIFTFLLYRHHIRVKTKNENDQSTTPKTKASEQSFSMEALWETGKIIKPWPQLLSFNFAVTLSIFPGLLTASAKSLSNSETFIHKYFIPLTFLTFDIFDLIGKVMPSIVLICGTILFKMGPKSISGKLFPLLRALFIPLFLSLSNFDNLNFNFAPKGSNGDWFYFVLVGLLAWSGGWGNAVCLINAPLSAIDNNKAKAKMVIIVDNQDQDRDQDQDIKIESSLSNELGDQIGSLMSLSITFGLFSGSAMSFIIKKLLF